MLVAHVAVVDAAHRAQHFERPAIAAAEPAAMVFEPDAGAAHAALGAELVFDLEGNARSLVADGIAHHRVITAGEVVGIEERGKPPPVGITARVAAQHVDGVGRPDDLVALDVPVIGGKAGGFDGQAQLLIAGGGRHAALGNFQHGFLPGLSLEAES